ncbi:hypothetical protein GCM10007275_01010 [Jeotgalicoccus coquinae]|uniref:Oligopeptide-binding protein AppA n=1 Tax=Jeotgalicoccus coquinae TaxID=709509 RepID=A0A6V7RU20_9STAP|nr:hypothetical protein [Jeotgalicoccus coquinae]MBB6423233.1 hypothetical protein [Jeotgalicoccus coquinae]GGE09624.1 hypothetical protein GCM10007275_01010 [Jeotgalicoccus coquinae]CAD2081917.1 Oligopeptide-binding protein AppA precursor [Jeotgalicoccus coquinae]
MKRSKLMKGLALSSLLFVMAACANGEGEEESAEAETNKEGGEETAADDSNVYNYEDFPQTVSNEAEPSGTGTLNVGYTSDTPFDGTFNWAFYTLAPEADVLAYLDESVFTFDEDQQATNEGAIHYDMNEEDKTVTLQCRMV